MRNRQIAILVLLALAAVLPCCVSGQGHGSSAALSSAERRADAPVGAEQAAPRGETESDGAEAAQADAPAVAVARPDDAGQKEPEVRPTSAPTTQASQPVEPPNPQRTPLKMLDVFRNALREADENPARLADAVACLDFSRVDKDVAHDKGGEYARKLGELLQQLIRDGAIDLVQVPDDPAAETQVIGRDPLLLILERRDRVWRFAPSTVADIPRLHEVAHDLAESQAASAAASVPATTSDAAPVPEAVIEAQRTPRALVTHFLVGLTQAESNPERYVEVVDCMNFAAVEPNTAEAKSVEYAEQLGEILQRFIDDGVFKLEDLPDEADVPALTIGREPVLVILSQLVDGRWQFSARTVAQIPALHKQMLANRKPAEAPKIGPTNVPADLRSARATMETFLRSMSEGDLRAAVACMDMSGLSAAERESSATLLAGKLLLIMRRYAVVVSAEISDDPDADRPYIFLTSKFGRIEIARQASGEQSGQWLFTKETVRSIEKLYAAWETRPIVKELKGDPGISFVSLPSLWLREQIIAPSLKRSALGLQYWQGLGMGLARLAGAASQSVALRVLPWATKRVLRGLDGLPGFRVEAASVRPLAILALVATWWGGVQFLDLGARVVNIIWPAMRLVMVAAAAWALYASIDLLTAYSAARAARRETRLNDVLVPLVRKTLKVVIVAVGTTMILGVLGFEVNTLLAGLGIGGLAFSFAAKDTIANFFGSVNVVLDRPFQVGDWVRIGSYEGTIESVGLRSSRLRTAEDSQLIIPNSEIMIATINNMGRRRYRRTLTTLSVVYGTPPLKLEAFCEGVREIIRQHPFTRKEEYNVYVAKLGESSIDILLSCFHELPNWGTELRERHRLFLDIIRLAERLEIEFAFPTRTLYVNGGVTAGGSPAAYAEKDGSAAFAAAAAERAKEVVAGPTAKVVTPAPGTTEEAQKLGREQAQVVLMGDGNGVPT